MMLLLSAFAVAGAGPATQPATPNGALVTLSDAAVAGNTQRVQQLLYSSAPFDSVMLGAFARIAVADARFDSASVKQFGASAAASAGIDPARARARLEKLPIAVHGTQAEFTLPSDPPRQVSLRMIDGAWRVSPDFVTARIENAAPHELGGRYETTADAVDAVTADVQAGRYPTPAAAVQAADTARTRAAAGTDAQ